MATTTKTEATMGRYIPDDVRYMTHEVRIAEGFMAAHEVKREAPAVETCYCGKTVVATHGTPVRVDGEPARCPRECGPKR